MKEHLLTLMSNSSSYKSAVQHVIDSFDTVIPSVRFHSFSIAEYIYIKFDDTCFAFQIEMNSEMWLIIQPLLRCSETLLRHKVCFTTTKVPGKLKRTVILTI